jgi:hypothetical protein
MTEPRKPPAPSEPGAEPPAQPEEGADLDAEIVRDLEASDQADDARGGYCVSYSCVTSIVRK